MTQQLHAAIIMCAAQHKIPRNTLTKMFHFFGLSEVYVPAHARKPLRNVWSIYFSQPNTTYTEFIHSMNCWNGIIEYTTPEIDSLITQLHSGRIKWMQESNNSRIPLSSLSTNAPDSTNSTNSTLLSTNPRISQALSRLRMDMQLARESKIS